MLNLKHFLAINKITIILGFIAILMPNLAQASVATLRQTSADTFITNESVDSNFSETGYTGAGDWDSFQYRSLYKFNIPSFEHQIQAATLRLYVYDGFGLSMRKFQLHRLLVPADFREATWNNYDPLHTWTVPGGLGDVDPTLVGESVEFPNLYGAWVEIPLDASRLELIRNETVPNYGFLLTVAVENTENRSNLVKPWNDQNFAPQLVVNFNDIFNVVFMAGPNGSLVGDTGQTITEGNSSTPVSAVPNLGYGFSGWSDGSTQNPRLFASVLEDISVTANFEKTISGSVAPKRLPSTGGASLIYLAVVLSFVLAFLLK